MPFVHDLAKWITEFDAAGVTPTARERAKLHLLDAIGCAFAALGEPAPAGTLRAVKALGGTPECTVIGTSQRTSVANAVLANGVLVRTLDLNDMGMDPRASGHASDNIPTALAIGERHDCSGIDVLAAIVMGYEISSLMPSGPQVDRSVRGRWDSTSRSGIIAAAMAGWLMKLPPETLANAIALSISHCGTLGIVRRGQLSAAKSVANSMVAHTAMMATLMAMEGVTGPPTALEEWSAAMLGGADLSPLIAPRDGDFRMVDFAIKAFPAIGTSQAALAATLQCRAEIKDPDEIEGVHVWMADIPFVTSQVTDAERQDPHSRETADHSFPFLIAVALQDGEFTLRQYQGERWHDPAVRSLMARITLDVDNGLNEYGSHPCRILLTTKGGREVVAEVPYAPGHPKNPMGPEAVAEKFHRYAAAAVPQSRRDAIVEQAYSLDKQPSVRSLMALLGSQAVSV